MLLFSSIHRRAQAVFACTTWLLVGALAWPLVASAQIRDFEVRITPFNQIFPALDLSQGLLARGTPSADGGASVIGTGSGLVTVRLVAARDGESVQLDIDAAPWLAAPTHFDATLAHAGTTYELRPAFAWSARELAALTRRERITLGVRVQRDGAPMPARRVAVELRPLNEALYYVRDGRDSVDLAWIFAAFVNERDAVVDAVLDSAAQSGIVEKFSGYTDSDADGVLRQAWAIWHALDAHGIRYSGADPGVDRGPRVYSQHVRFLADTWADRSANCIDGSALLASTLQRIGLRSFLVLVPGHAFVGFYTDADSQHAAYLETTLLGRELPPLRELPGYASGDAPASASASLASFDAALRAGAARHTRVASKLDGHHQPDYVVIDIATARELGIRPIAVSSAAQTLATYR